MGICRLLATPIVERSRRVLDGPLAEICMSSGSDLFLDSLAGPMLARYALYAGLPALADRPLRDSLSRQTTPAKHPSDSTQWTLPIHTPMWPTPSRQYIGVGRASRRAQAPRANPLLTRARNIPIVRQLAAAPSFYRLKSM